MSKPPASMRLDRLLSNLGYGSRKEIAAACRAGAITLSGDLIRNADQTIPLDLVREGALALNGEAVDPPAPLTIMLNKPAGHTCSRREAGSLVYDLLPYRWRGRKPILSTIGRLDKDSTGQLLLTDDGDLLHRIIHPRTHAPKHYRVELSDPLRGDEAARFATGAFLLEGDDKPLRSAIWRADGDRSGVMILTEGRYHQIRRMFAALGNRVTALHRFQTGGLALGDLDAGQYKILGPEELESIFRHSA
ncbi:MAG: rRNA pseudouridine synthase [Gammaproteobacteria bacterium]|nr:rRNA pseudouridine synthase [Gammaproteobacteria bacterium]